MEIRIHQYLLYDQKIIQLFNLFLILLFVGSTVIFNIFGNVILGGLVPLTINVMIIVLFGPGLKNTFKNIH